MDHNQVGRYWNENAAVWTRLSRAGYDVYRDQLNTPAFLAMLPPVEGLRGLDIARVFLEYAAASERQQPLGIRHLAASAVELPFPAAAFDFATGFMSFMDIPETGRVLTEAQRVLKPGGFLQFSITHPCFDTPHRRNLRDANGRTYAYEVGDYFRCLDGDISEWLFSAAPLEERQGLPNFKIPRFSRPLNQWLNLLIEQGFVLEQFAEPRPDEETVSRYPNIQDAQVVAYFLIIRARKPG